MIYIPSLALSFHSRERHRKTKETWNPVWRKQWMHIRIRQRHAQVASYFRRQSGFFYYYFKCIFFCLLACRRRTNKTKSLDLLASIPSAWVFHSVQGAISSQHKKEELFLLFSYTHLWKRCPLVMYQRAQEKGRNKFPMRYKKERTTPLFVVKKVKASGHVGGSEGCGQVCVV